MIFALLLLVQAEPPTLSRPVTDLTGGVVSRELDAELTRAIDALQALDSTQVVVLVVATTGAMDIAQFAHATAEKNGIGQKDKNNGVLIVVAKDDRRCRIEVGYGLEHILPDALCDQIIRKEMVPKFKSGDYAGGVRAGTTAVIGAVKGEYKADSTSKLKNIGSYVFWTIFFLFLLAAIFGRAMPGRRYGGGLFYLSMGGRGFRSSGGGGGGGWSGGGGSFGGGGAGGSW